MNDSTDDTHVDPDLRTRSRVHEFVRLQVYESGQFPKYALVARRLRIPIEEVARHMRSLRADNALDGLDIEGDGHGSQSEAVLFTGAIPPYFSFVSGSEHLVGKYGRIVVVCPESPAADGDPSHDRRPAD